MTEGNVIAWPVLKGVQSGSLNSRKGKGEEGKERCDASYPARGNQKPFAQSGVVEERKKGEREGGITVEV